MSLKIGVIVSTTRPTRVGRTVADWFLSQVKDNVDLEFELIDLAEIDLPFMSEPKSPLSGEYTQDKTKAWSKKVHGLDGFVFVMAEYNSGYPAPLKNAFDSVYHEWAKKPVAFVGYGTYGAARSIDHMVAAVAKVNAMPLTSSVVGILKPWDAVAEGTVKPEFVVGNIDELVANLTWWARFLAAARK